MYRLGYIEFKNLVLPGHWRIQNLILKRIFKTKVFPFFEAVLSAFSFKVCKKCYYDIITYFSQKGNMGIKTRRIFFFFNLMLISNPLNKFLTFITECKSFRPITILGWTFSTFYNGYELSIKFCVIYVFYKWVLESYFASISGLGKKSKLLYPTVHKLNRKKFISE